MEAGGFMLFWVLLEEAQTWLFYTAGKPCLDDFGALDNPGPAMGEKWELQNTLLKGARLVRLQARSWGPF